MAISEGVFMGILSVWAIIACPDSSKVYLLTGMSAFGVLSMLMSIELQRRTMNQTIADLEKKHGRDYALMEKFVTQIAEQVAEQVELAKKKPH